MKPTYSIALASTALTLLCGSAIGAPAQSFPDAIASLEEQAMNEIARTMVNSLTPTEKRIISAEGGLGADAINLASMLENTTPVAPELEAGTTANEFLGMILSDEIKADLTDMQLTVLQNRADILDEGKPLAMMCYAPGTNPKYIAVMEELFNYQYIADEDGHSRFVQGNRWSRTATDGTGLSQGDPTTITYSFVPDGSFIPNTQGLGSGGSELFAWLDGRYGDTATWQNLFHSVFERWGELTGVTYVHELNDDGSNLNSNRGVLGVRGDVRISAFNYTFDGNFGVLGYNPFPNDGDMILDAYDIFYNSTANNSLALRNVAAHEHGHGLGMAHVCPQTGTKLMEPSYNGGYDGPQLDDILNGQRHYGDPYEPNNSFGLATDLGSFTDSGIESFRDMSIDDNSDEDLYKFDLTERAKITFVVSPDAAAYLNGGQLSNGSCSSGSTIDYNSLQDLQLEMFLLPDLQNPVATVNNTVSGGSETLVYEAEETGMYYVRVSPATVINNVQRYRTTMIMAELPPVLCPADLTEDGELDFFDVSAFLDAFGAQESAADFTGDGEYDFFDVSEFLDQFGAGCP